MKRFLTNTFKCLAALVALIAIPQAVLAEYEGEGELLMTIHTNLYQEDGESNQFSIQFGAVKAGTYIDIDCGYGTEEFEVGVAVLDSSSVVGSAYSGKVSAEGIIRVYGDPASLDYLNASGCGITSIEWNDNLNLELLNLEHNSLTNLDLSKMTNLRVLYLMDNPFTKDTPFYLGKMEKLIILEMGEIDYVSPNFDFKNLPALTSVDAYHSLSLKTADTSQCPNLVRLSLEMTGVPSVDVSKNDSLCILNVNDSPVTSLDLSNNKLLQELYISHGSGRLTSNGKFKSIDLTHNPKLYALFCSGNELTSLDVSKNPNLYALSANKNKLTSIDLSNNTALYTVNLRNNYMDFATLPLEQTTWGEYYYDQYDMEVSKYYKVGDVIDLSKRVLRDGSVTGCKLYYIEKDAPTTGVELDAEYYTYADGKITLNKNLDKQMYAEFTNDKFEAYPLYTTKFTVLTAADYDNNTRMQFQFTSSAATGADIKLAVGVKGATAENPKGIYVDYGDGSIVTGATATSEYPTDVNVSGKRAGTKAIKIYTDRDDEVTAITIDGISVNNIQTKDLSELTSLEIRNAGLQKVDLVYNTALRKLDLSNNALTSLSLKGKTSYFYKSYLRDVNVSGNQLDSLKVDDLYSMKYLDISNNKFAELDLTDADNLIRLDAHGNKFKKIVMTYSDSLQWLDVSDNLISQIYVPEDAPLTYYNVSNNKFTFNTFPDNLWNLNDAQFIYAPQKPKQIGVVSPGTDLTDEYSVGGSLTTYVWKRADGTVMVKGTDYIENTNGSFKFLSPVFEKYVYCEMTNAARPQFTGDNILKTTQVKAIDMPQYEVANFTTTMTGDSVAISMASENENTSVFIDWKGDGNVTQYLLTTEHQEFKAVTTAGKNVRVLVADPNDNFTVLSITGATMGSFSANADRLTKLYGLFLYDNGLDDATLTLPSLPSLVELGLSNNNLTTIDFSKFPNLYYLTLNGNKFQSIDLSKATKLGWAYLGNNGMSSIKFGGNSALVSLDLGTNSFTECPDFTEAPNIEQIWLNNNKISDISSIPEQLQGLKVISVNNNKLTFKSLIYDKMRNLQKLSQYFYSGQEDIDVVALGKSIDLSEQLMVGDSVTTYRWFFGKPTYDDDLGDFDGEELIADEEYTVSEGVTSFKMENAEGDWEDLVCVMTNNALPNLVLYTKPITMSATAIRNVDADTQKAAATSYYTADGKRVPSPTKNGIYIMRKGTKTSKIVK